MSNPEGSESLSDTDVPKQRWPNFAFVSTGSEEGDAKEAAAIRRHVANREEGLCPNGCAPIVWDDAYSNHCNVCGFQGFQNTPRVESA